MTRLCGCQYVSAQGISQYLPLFKSSAHTKIDSTAYRTTLTQQFVNPPDSDVIQEGTYVFPIYDGVSVVAFACTVGTRVIRGIVKEKLKARKEYDEAVQRGETAGLLEQGPTGDVFSMKLGNIPSGDTVLVEITYVGELKHDLGLGGIRYTLPTFISPRYGGDAPSGNLLQDHSAGISITVDIAMPTESPILNIKSPSHPIDLKLGSLSKDHANDSKSSLASTTLALGATALDKDFVLEILHKDTDQPKALLENHPDIKGQRALMVTLVPHTIPAEGPPPELIIVADQSGSMSGSRTETLKSALRILLKSLPLETKFNICAFGSRYELLWPKSERYDKRTLNEALNFVSSFRGCYGGTETQNAVKAAVESRDPERNLAIILATDGDIWAQDYLFGYLNEQIANSKTFIRVFPLGIGNSVSSSLIEGVARAGNGFAQAVAEGEKQDAKVIRMLKGALTPDTGSWNLAIEFKEEDEDFVLVESVSDSLRVMVLDDEGEHEESISITAESEKEGADEKKRSKEAKSKVSPPKVLQSPQVMPPLYSQSRSTIYLLLSPEIASKPLKSITLGNKSGINDFEITIPVQHLPDPATTLHSLAAKRAILELEEGRGWLAKAIDSDSTSAESKLIKDTHSASFSDIVKAECVRLGEQYQIAGKHTSFVAVRSDESAAEVESKEVVTPTPKPRSPSPDEVIARKRISGRSRRGGVGGRINHVTPPGSFRSFTKSVSVEAESDEDMGFGLDFEEAPPPKISSNAPQKRGKTENEPSPWTSPDSWAVPEVHKSPAPETDSHSGLRLLGMSAAPYGQQTTQELGSSKTAPSKAPAAADADPLLDLASPGAVPTAAAATPFPHSRDSRLSDISQMARQPMASAAPQKRRVKLDFDAENLKSVADSNDAAIKDLNDSKRLEKLVDLQSFDGFWEFDRLFKTVVRIAAGAKPLEPTKEEVWATIVAVVFLETKLAAEKDSWELVVKKAMDWLRKEGYADREDGMVKGFWEEAEKLVKEV